MEITDGIEIIKNMYSIDHNQDKVIGTGSSANVYIGTNLQNKTKVAIKRMMMSDVTIKRIDITNEISIMKSLDHPNIVKCIDSHKTDSTWYIIMEYCNMGTLENVIEYNIRMSNQKNMYFNREIVTYYYLSQLKDALIYLRAKKCSHRDIKPKNILLTKLDTLNSSDILQSVCLEDSGNIFKYDEQLDASDTDIKNSSYDYTENICVKLCDFGLTKSGVDSNDMMETVCGTPLFMAPEIIKRNRYTLKSDIWSFGILMHQLLYGSNPLNCNNFELLIKKINSTSQINIDKTKNFTPLCTDLLEKILKFDPSERIDWDSFVNHKWFEYWKSNIDNGIKSNMFLNSTNFVSSSTPTIDVPVVKQPNFSDQIGSYSPSNSLGRSGLSKMKLGNSFSRSYMQNSYSDYPASYPPVEQYSSGKSYNMKQEPFHNNTSGNYTNWHTTRTNHPLTNPRDNFLREHHYPNSLPSLSAMTSSVSVPGSSVLNSNICLNMIIDYEEHSGKTKPINIIHKK